MENLNISVEKSTNQNSTIILRLVAFIIDGIVIGIPAVIISSIIGAIFNNASLSSLIYVAAFITYSGLMESSSYQATLGKKLLGLKVVGTGGQRLSQSESFIRSAIKYILSPFTAELIFLAVFFTKGNLAVHDIIAKTKVLKK